MAPLDKLISPDFLDDMREPIEGPSMVLNACVVVEYIDSEGNHRLATGFSDDLTYFAKEGMCRSLLRDAMMIPYEAERREAARRYDELDD